MGKDILTLSISILLISLNGCRYVEQQLGVEGELPDTFTIMASKDGSAYRLNKKTGEILFINEFCSTLVSGTEKGAKSSLPLPKFLNEINFTKHKFNLSIKWLDGYLYYRFTVAPASESLAAKRIEYYSFTLYLDDSFGYTIIENEIPLIKLSHVVDEKGKITHYEYKGKVSCSLTVYNNIQSWNVSSPL